MQDEDAGDLTVDLGYRYSDYQTNKREDLFTADTYKVGIEYQPIEQLKVRAALTTR